MDSRQPAEVTREGTSESCPSQSWREDQMELKTGEDNLLGSAKRQLQRGLERDARYLEI